MEYLEYIIYPEYGRTLPYYDVVADVVMPAGGNWQLGQSLPAS